MSTVKIVQQYVEQAEEAAGCEDAPSTQLEPAPESDVRHAYARVPGSTGVLAPLVMARPNATSVTSGT